MLWVRALGSYQEVSTLLVKHPSDNWIVPHSVYKKVDVGLGIEWKLIWEWSDYWEMAVLMAVFGNEDAREYLQMTTGFPSTPDLIGLAMGAF